MRQSTFAAGTPPRTPLREVTVHPRLAGFGGRGRRGKGKEREGKGGRGEGRGGERKVGPLKQKSWLWPCISADRCVMLCV